MLVVLESFATKAGLEAGTNGREATLLDRADAALLLTIGCRALRLTVAPLASALDETEVSVEG